MTYAQLRPRVTARLQAIGAAMDDLTVRPSDDTGVAALITDGLRAWSAMAQQIRATGITLDIIDGQRAYSLTGTGFSVPMIRVDQVRTDEGIALTDYHGRPGPISMKELEDLEMAWTAADEGEPRVWARNGLEIVLFPTPSASDEWTVAGISLHPAVSADADEILVDVRDEDALITYLAAEWALRSQFSESLAAARSMGVKAAMEAQARNVAIKDPRKGGALPSRSWW
jgi:hypothetical protein